ncbi:16S rRNA (guanine(966)-N(2))-methyltransferase RsmD [Sporolituus thermophilus]|uniref:16S rRNA (Guanine(966)-N(2))-methyltransferase RsmD n=1 Tax=Sporolituus thermophilus DSM 23256 TaxID=1123285 RepID=A0A1G7NSD7_9FIRM|nr:16S rRNA (guanine(966)-N(2))-methyltransferase RsmD [Sporolituus thermophilus]SDF76896.1 16S rRNA (guanine(966)-N(2))-methyltransferase RsmD [Sporolituus thermophilus DSM 23256]
MRIITGSAKGTKLKTPRGLDVRPTADRVKESMFNILGSVVLDADVLDLFAGTGNLGLEAVSRGAKSAIFVDNSPASIALIKENIIHTKLADRTHVYKSDALRYIDRAAQLGQNFDLIFCDPPYNKGLATAVAEKLDNRLLLRENGLLVIEHSRREILNDNFFNLNIVLTKQYGETMISFIQRKAKVIF